MTILAPEPTISRTPPAPPAGGDVAAADADYPRKKWTVDECYQMIEAGILPQGRWELIEGDIVDKMGQNNPHAYVVLQLLESLLRVFGVAFVRIQLPVRLNDQNEPEPDACVTREAKRTYLDRGHPTGADVLLIAEASDSTLAADRRIKGRLYAAAGIPEYWIVDIDGRRLIVHRAPEGEQYADVRAFSDTESVVPLAAPDSVIRVADLLP